MSVTKSQFLAYEAVRRSGVTNMFDPAVETLSGLNSQQVAYIIQNYDALKAKYGTDVPEGEAERIKEICE